ncbi:MAG: flagellar biosynthesis protein FlhA [Planctomycetota bacterium]
MTRLQRWPELILPLGVISAVMVILVPLPAVVLDALLAASLAISVVMLLTTIYVRSPLEFSVFPTLLLASTVGRLVLNIASTRLLLTQGATHGLDAAGGVIRGFGEFVAGDRLVVGVVLFAIIFVIQFIVITKGATRISEVAARFSLDGLPGRQMAIDADTQAGIIDHQEAQRRRQALSQQADFHAAMDGAGKFVRGDAVAGLLITLVNIIGGLVLGMTEGGMSLAEAADVFTRLTIGDGLVSQIPALLVSLGAGLLTTRGGERSDLPRDVATQLFANPRVLVVSAAFLGLLVFTRLPKIPLLTLGGGCLMLAVQGHRRQKQDGVSQRSSSTPTSTAAHSGMVSQRTQPSNAPTSGSSPSSASLGPSWPGSNSPTHGPVTNAHFPHAHPASGNGSHSAVSATHRATSELNRSDGRADSRLDSRGEGTRTREDRVEDFLAVDPLEIELGLRLLKLADAARGGDLLRRVTAVRQRVAAEIGLILPKVRIRDNLRLEERGYRLRLAQNVVAQGTLQPDSLLAVDPGLELEPLGDQSVIDPVSRRPAYWIEGADRERAESQGYSVQDPASLVAGHLLEVARQHADELLTRDAVKHLLEELRRTAPAVVDDLIPNQLRLADLQQVLRMLLREEVPIRQLALILETLGDYAPRTTDPAVLVEHVRERLARTLSARYRDRDQRLFVVALDPELEDRLAAARRDSDAGVWRWKPTWVDALCDGIADELPKLTRLRRPPVVLASPAVRAIVKQLTAARLPRLAVLSYREVTRDTHLESVGVVTDPAERDVDAGWRAVSNREAAPAA